MVLKFAFNVISEILNPLFVISLALFVSIGYILSLVTSVNIQLWVIVLTISVLVTLIGLCYRFYLCNGFVSNVSSSWWQWGLPLIPLLVFVPPMLVVADNAALQMLNHGDIHLSYVYQFLYSSTPPDNVFVAGYPANYYWLYHAYIATLSHIVGFAPASVAMLVSFIALFSCLLWIGKTLVTLKLARPGTLYLGLTMVFVMFALNLPAVLHGGGTTLFDGQLDLRTLRTMLVDGADRRLYSSVSKFFNFTSAGLGILYFCVALYAVVRIVKGRYSVYHLVLISATGIATLAFSQVYAIYIVLVLILGFVVHQTIQTLRYSQTAKRGWRHFFSTLPDFVSPRLAVVWFLLSAILAFPLLKYNSEISYNYQSSLSFAFDVENLQMIIGASYALIPIVILQLIWTLRNKDEDQWFFATLTVVGFFIALMLSLHNRNQYKGMIAFSMLLALMTLYAVQWMIHRQSVLVRWGGRLLLAIGLVFAFSNVAYMSYFYAKQPEHYPVYYGKFYFDGTHMSYEGRVSKRLRAYEWIRANTEPDAVAMMPTGVDKFDAIFYERVTYIRGRQFAFVDNIPEYEVRSDKLRSFYKDDLDIDGYRELYNYFISFDESRTIYAVIKDEEVPYEVMMELGAERVFENPYDGAHVYRLNPSDGE